MRSASATIATAATVATAIVALSTITAPSAIATTTARIASIVLICRREYRSERDE